MSIPETLAARGYRCFGEDRFRYGAVLYQRRVADEHFVNVYEFPPRERAPAMYEVESVFDRGDGTWAKLLVYGFPADELTARLGAIERAIGAARQTLITTPSPE